MNFINLNNKEDEKDNFIYSSGTDDECNNNGTECQSDSESESNRDTNPDTGSGSESDSRPDSGSNLESDRDQKSKRYPDPETNT